MAALTQDQVRKVFSDSGPLQFGLFEVRQITSGDTINLTDLGFFRVVKQAVWVGATVSGAAVATVTGGTTVTAPGAFTNDGVYLLVAGVPT